MKEIVKLAKDIGKLDDSEAIPLADQKVFDEKLFPLVTEQLK